MSYSFRACKIISNDHIQDNIFLISMRWDGADAVAPGQFFMLKAPQASPLLPRPLSVCELAPGGVSFCYAVVGEGTGALSRLRPGDTLHATGPLGNGFADMPAAGSIAIVAGGIGIAPFVEVAKRLTPESVALYAGFASKSYLLDKFAPLAAEIRVSTDDGSEGYHGFITDIFDPSPYDLALTCGPEPMMQKVIARCNAAKIPVLASFDKRMACGVGACLVCACQTKYGYKRCCADGPVFRGDDFDGIIGTRTGKR